MIQKHLDTLTTTFLGGGGVGSQRSRTRRKRRPKMVSRSTAVRMAKAANRKGYRAGKRARTRRY